MSIQIINNDVFMGLSQLQDDSVDCCVTSPPYWGLRDYGVEGQIGLEPTMTDHLATMVAVFEEVRRVLKPEGTCWVNYGDCYATTPNGRSAADTKAAGGDDRTFRDKPFSTIGGALKAKDLCMIPNRLAIALQDAGWWVRSEIIWHKPNPMPESIRDRPATAHEKIFLLTKSARYFYDAEAVMERVADSSSARLNQNIEDQAGSNRANGGRKTNGSMKAVGGCDGKRNLRNVWTIPTAAFSDAHFATFPSALVEKCIIAGCPKGGLVLDPFGGSGTTGMVADRLGRNAVLIELNPEYAEMARKRVSDDAGMFAEVSA